MKKRSFPATDTKKANEIYEGVLHRLNGFLLDPTAVYGKGRLQVGAFFSSCDLLYWTWRVVLKWL
ncbi:hypothetical protein JIR001_10920 [Polycladomyces abyssicola]|uniref:Uncharacterized protein n=1 Tax=Polycladomyces abyssicola TaxID=1125966 RepID=A0A8D5UFF0_9BACL|nr:hypothetical protein JIR001_10920 [Polycladomyces abyssicola]